jgi:putative transcriptional regulator
MSEENLVRARLLPDGTVVQIHPDGSTSPLDDTTDWERLAAMTEEEIETNALSDPDSGWQTDEEFEKSRRVYRAELVRQSTGLSQEDFATRYEIPLESLRSWESGAAMPDGTTRAYLEAIFYFGDELGSLLDRKRKLGSAA